MDRNKVYDYFTLQAQLYMAVMNWLRKTVKDTKYESIPYKIDNIAQLDGGCIGLNVTFINGAVIEGHESYHINIKELEEC